MDSNENVTKEVVETKKQNKISTPVIIIAVAALLIAVGVGLIVTGNNKSFLAKDKQESQKDPEPAKVVVPTELDVEKATEVINAEKAKDVENENWELGEVLVLASGDNGTFLVKYDKVYETNTETVQTIISFENENWTAKLPGWPEGSEDLTAYNFVYYNAEPVEEPPVEEPIDEPPVEPIVEPTEEPPVELNTVEPTVDEPVAANDNGTTE